jgi:hypothetical protein
MALSRALSYATQSLIQVFVLFAQSHKADGESNFKGFKEHCMFGEIFS